MDTIKIRLAGYEYALRAGEGDLDDTPVMEAYERLLPGASYLDDGFKYFEWGVNDLAIQFEPLLSLGDVARMSGFTARYIRAEAEAGRIRIESGEGKNRRISYQQYREWMDSPRRGSHSK